MEETAMAGENSEEEEVKPMLNQELRETVCKRLDEWRQQQGYAISELNSTMLALRLDIPKCLLVQYIREVEGKTFRIWLSDLRLDEAKRIIIAHPEYSNETIAEACGFSRSHLQVKFKESTGLTTNDWRTAYVQQDR